MVSFCSECSCSNRQSEDSNISQVQYMNQVDTALVTFSNHQSAKSAHSGPKPVFDNRFIKIFWHHDSSQQKPRSEPNMNRSSLRLDNSAPVKKPAAATGVELKKQAIIKQLLLEQKNAVRLLEKTGDKNKFMPTIKQLAKQLENLRSANKAPVSRPVQVKAKPQSSQAAKELLDTELDILQKQKTGEDTASLQNKLTALKKKAQSLGIAVPGQGGFRGGKSTQHNPVPSAPPPPSAISVTNFDVEEKDAIISHFLQFGQVVEKEFVKEPKPMVVVEFSKHHDAHVAAMHGTQFGSKRLVLKWYKPAPEKPAAAAFPAPASAAVTTATNSSNVKKPTSSVSTDSVLDEGEDLLAAGEGQEEGDIDETLLLGEEDYDEDDNKRSW